MRRFWLHPEAEAEALDAAARIKTDDVHQGELFVRALEDALDWARTEPLVFRRFNGEFRKVKLGKFRYSLVFRLFEEEIQVIAVAHMSRKPGYWKDRRSNWPSP